MAKKWSCPSCTFLNEEQVRNRCTMCRAQRPRNVSPKRDQVVEILDLDSPPYRKTKGKTGEMLTNPTVECLGDEGTNCEDPMRGTAVASTVSARKRQKRDDHGGRGRLQKHRNPSTQLESNKSDHSFRKMIDPPLDIDGTKSGSSKKAIAAKREMPKNTKHNSTSKVQQTLFGSIVRTSKKEDVKKASKLKKNPTKRQTHEREMREVDVEHDMIENEFNDHQYSAKPMHEEEEPPAKPHQKFNSNPKIEFSDTYSKAMEILRTKFSIPSLRNLQPVAVQSALKGKSQIIVMATGGGKSLCYQLPAAVLPGLTIVVSPLIALMVDQVNALCRKGIEAVMISSAMGEKDKKLIWKRLEDTGMGDRKNDGSEEKNKKKKEKEIKLLYCTPELIQTSRFRTLLSNFYGRGLLALVAIDEAHCLSTWGHDFRPAYRKLSWIRQSFPDVPCMACTATATSKVIKDIKQILCFNSGEKCHMSTFNRPNVTYEVRHKDSMGDTDALKDLVRTVKVQHKKAEEEGAPCSGIVYVHKRDDTTMISASLQKAGIAAEPYHAGLKDKDRKRIQQEWTDGIVKVAIATVAFGMGIDLAHVRYVLHWSMSKTVEGFYQESGRAGRDGLASKSIVYYSKDDAAKFAFLIRKNSERNEAKGKKSAVDDNNLDALNKMVEYCTTSCCRRKYLLKHFGEDIDPQIVCKKSCDYCIDPKKVEKALVTSSISKAVRDVKRQRFRHKSEALLDGGYNHGIEDDYFDDSEKGSAYYRSTSDSGLGITCAPSDGFTTGSGKRLNGVKSSTKSVLSKYEALECRASSGRKGFVNFKAKTKLQYLESEGISKEHFQAKSTSISIPSHVMQQIQTKVSNSLSSQKVALKEKSSKDISKDAARVRAELEEIKKKQAKLLAKLRQK